MIRRNARGTSNALDKGDVRIPIPNQGLPMSMTKQASNPLILAALLTGVLFTANQGLQSAPVAEPAEAAPGTGQPERVELFSGKIEEVNLEAGWLKVARQRYLIAKHTRILNGNKPIKMADLKAGIEIHGSAQKNETGQLVAAVVKVGQVARPNAPGRPPKI